MANPTVVQINALATSQTLLPSKPSRVEAIIQNNSSSVLYVKFGAVASPINYSIKLFTDDVVTTSYRGQIDGMWQSATGSALITEI